MFCVPDMLMKEAQQIKFLIEIFHSMKKNFIFLLQIQTKTMEELKLIFYTGFQTKMKQSWVCCDFICWVFSQRKIRNLQQLNFKAHIFLTTVFVLLLACHGCCQSRIETSGYHLQLQFLGSQQRLLLCRNCHYNHRYKKKNYCTHDQNV